MRLKFAVGPFEASGCLPSDKKSELTLMKTGNWQNRSVEEKMEESTPQSPEKYIRNKHRSQTAKAGGWNKVKQEVDQEGGLVDHQYNGFHASTHSDNFCYLFSHSEFEGRGHQ